MTFAKDQAEEICAEIHRILVTDWDPIGVMDDPAWPRDEYDRYIGEIFRLRLVRGESAEFLARHLCIIENAMLGLGSPPVSARMGVARKLTEIAVRLSNGRTT